MAENSKIQWTDHTVNFVIGCSKVDALCANCYADAMDDRRFSKTLPGTSKNAPVRHWGVDAPRYLRTEEAQKELCSLNRKARKAGRIDKVFINSLSDTFEGRIDLDGARVALFKSIEDCESLIFQLLTKRPENVTRMVPEQWLTNWPKNAWMGTSVGARDDRMLALIKIPATVRFLSIEPMIEDVDLGFRMDQNRSDAAVQAYKRASIQKNLQWVIVGGESGPRARPCNLAWIRGIVRDCKMAGVPVFVKQLGAKPYDEQVYTPSDSQVPECVTTWLRPNDKKGGDITEFPEDLRVREVPTVIF